MVEISPGIVGATLYLLDVLKRYQIDFSKEFVCANPFLQNTKTTDVLAFAAGCGLTASRQDAVVLTEFGSLLTCPDISELERKRILLREYIRSSRPAWASLLTKGRMESLPLFRDDVKACFLDAGLMETPPPGDVVKWWDDVSNILYGRKNHARTGIGRHGEWLTLHFEKSRTGKAAGWLSIESNQLGYDILSVIAPQHTAPLLIEVKTSNTVFSSSLAYITRHEWEIAQRSLNYQFYFWSIYHDSTRLAILNTQDIQPHIPLNTGDGHWETVSLHYSTFQEKFVDIHPASFLPPDILCEYSNLS